MALRPNPQFLVCSNCWSSLFSSPSFCSLCHTPSEETTIQYTAHVSQIQESATLGCTWCTLIFSLKPSVEDLTLGEGESPLTELPIRFGLGPQGENFTPAGNNRFGLWINGASFFLSAFAMDDDAVSRAVTAREIVHQVNSPKAFGEVRKWLKECASHEKCNPPTRSSLPSRVIEVSPEADQDTPRLLETKGLVDYYVALSYCWGPNQSGLTTKRSLDTSLRRLDMSTLSKTIQDAITTTRRLGMKYLWVDAICIIQDSTEDKIIELASMCKTYQQATITIVAANASDANQGFLEDRSRPSSSTKIPFWALDGQLGTASLRLEGWYDDEKEPINTRAWTLQERLLAPRLLIYATHTLQYQCQQHTINLGDSINLPAGLAAWRLPLSSNAMEIQAAGRVWGHIITMYSQRRLSYLEDKLTALAGVAEYFYSQLESEYLAGLWSGNVLPRLLLWQASRTENYTPCSIYTAPSWSWASLDSPVFFSAFYNHHAFDWYEVDNLAAEVALDNTMLRFGRLKNGHLRLTVYVRYGLFQPPQWIQWESSEGYRDSAATAYLDDGLLIERKVICVAIARRTYDPDGNEDLPVTFGAVARSMFAPPDGDSGNWLAIDGLIIAPAGGRETYRRTGCFFGAEEKEFKDFPRQSITLI